MRRNLNRRAPARGRVAALYAAATLLTSSTACHAHAPGTPPGPPPVDAPVQAHGLERPPPPLLPDHPPVLRPVPDTLTTRVCGDDPRLTACAVHRSDGSPHLLGMAVRGRTIAVAW